MSEPRASLRVLACREGGQWVAQAIEQDMAAQHRTMVGAIAELGVMFDGRDHVTATMQNVAPLPPAPASYERAFANGRQLGTLLLGAKRVALVSIGVSPCL